MEKRCGCGKSLEQWGHQFIRIELCETLYNGDYNEPTLETKVQKVVECCTLCTLNALKNVLIGQRDDAHLKFDKYCEKR